LENANNQINQWGQNLNAQVNEAAQNVSDNINQFSETINNNRAEFESNLSQGLESLRSNYNNSITDIQEQASTIADSVNRFRDSGTQLVNNARNAVQETGNSLSQIPQQINQDWNNIAASLGNPANSSETNSTMSAQGLNPINPNNNLNQQLETANSNLLINANVSPTPNNSASLNEQQSIPDSLPNLSASTGRTNNLMPNEALDNSVSNRSTDNLPVPIGSSGSISSNEFSSLTELTELTEKSSISFSLSPVTKYSLPIDNAITSTNQSGTSNSLRNNSVGTVPLTNNYISNNQKEVVVNSTGPNNQIAPTIAANRSIATNNYRLYVTKKDDNLITIAESELGDASRWGEIKKLNASVIEAMKGNPYFQAGTTIYLPK
ncbi:MAG: hypothetical protein Q4C95_10850, partial [Planctomycetia bacterium]|nr:hypothetical protein [Planctomycetia bacterium]